MILNDYVDDADKNASQAVLNKHVLRYLSGERALW